MLDLFPWTARAQRRRLDLTEAAFLERTLAPVPAPPKRSTAAKVRRAALIAFGAAWVLLPMAVMMWPR